MLGIDRQVEIEQHGLAVVGQQDVRRLQVTVEDAPFVGMGQTIRQPSADPEDGMDIAHAFKLSQKIADRRGFLRGLSVEPECGCGGSLVQRLTRPRTGGPVRRRLAVVQGADQDLARGRRGRARADRAQDVGQGRRTEVWHAHRRKIFGTVHRVDRHDVGVLEPGQGLRLAEDVGGNLQDDAAAGEARLLSQIDAAEGPLTQLLKEPETEKLLAWFGETTHGARHAQGRFRVGMVRVPENLGWLGLRGEAGTPVVHVAAGVVCKQTKLLVGAGGALQAGGSARSARDG